MTIDERYKYLRIRQKEYRKGGPLERTGMLDAMLQVTQNILLASSTPAGKGAAYPPTLSFEPTTSL